MPAGGAYRRVRRKGLALFFRFAAGLFLVVLVSMAGVWLEKQTLELRSAVAVQYYQTDLLLEINVRLRLETQRLTAASHLTAPGTGSTAAAVPGQKKRPSSRVSNNAENRKGASEERLPLLRFQHPFNPEGID